MPYQFMSFYGKLGDREEYKSLYSEHKHCHVWGEGLEVLRGTTGQFIICCLFRVSACRFQWTRGS